MYCLYMATATVEKTLEHRVLTAFDRCDSCGHRSYHRVTTQSGAEFLFCGHHGNKYRDALFEHGVEDWVDESSFILDD